MDTSIENGRRCFLFIFGVKGGGEVGVGKVFKESEREGYGYVFKLEFRMKN